MRDHAEWESLAWIDGVGALDANDRDRLDEHVAGGCARCAKRRAEAEAAAAVLPLALVAMAPSAALRERVLASVRAPTARRPATVRRAATKPPRSRRRGLAEVAAALAAGIAIAVLGAWLAGERGARQALEARLARSEAQAAALARDRDALVRERDGLLREAATLARERDAYAATVDVVGAPAVRLLALEGRGAAAGARARAYLEPEAGRVVLFGNALPPAPPARCYQLWLIREGTPVSAGVFDADERGRARLEAAATAARASDVALAVTIEPAGGLPAPSGPIVLAAP